MGLNELKEAAQQIRKRVFIIEFLLALSVLLSVGILSAINVFKSSLFIFSSNQATRKKFR
jgi:hypothetical protein